MQDNQQPQAGELSVNTLGAVVSVSLRHQGLLLPRSGTVVSVSQRAVITVQWRVLLLVWRALLVIISAALLQTLNSNFLYYNNIKSH